MPPTPETAPHLTTTFNALNKKKLCLKKKHFKFKPHLKSKLTKTLIFLKYQ